MLRRTVSFLLIAVALMSFAGSSSFARSENRPAMRSEKVVVVMHRHRRHVVVVRRHRRRAALRVNVHL
jgi:hypothetical protein